ncbi:hypothetical protein HYZ98_02480 [Candidatus Peregrinibacteria bacterium]|nr:hypothetical protein [Candidatus Peregrinibacteria bacterium]
MDQQEEEVRKGVQAHSQQPLLGVIMELTRGRNLVVEDRPVGTPEEVVEVVRDRRQHPVRGVIMEHGKNRLVVDRQEEHGEEVVEVVRDHPQQ